jgi:hypothetical protein
MARDGVKIFVRPILQISFDRVSINQMKAYHRALPSAKADFVCSTLTVKCGFSMNGILVIAPVCRESKCVVQVETGCLGLRERTHAPLYPNPSSNTARDHYVMIPISVAKCMSR